MKGNRNLEVYMKFFTIVALALLLVYELVSGKVYYYVHPRYLYSIWGAVIALLIFAASLAGELRRGRHNSNIKKYFLYLIPIVLALLFPAIEGGNGNIAIAQSSKGGSNLNGSNLNGSSAAGKAGDSEKEASGDSTGDSQSSNDIVEDNTDNSAWSNLDDTAEEKDRSLKYKNKTKDGVILISDDEYGCWYFELFDYLKDFKGKRYQFTAQVFPMEGLKTNQFLAGRYIMTCCAVDLMGYGIITESDLSSKLKENEWITVTGTIEEYDYEGSKVPLLKDVVIRKTKAPKDEYVYYYYY